MSLATRPLYIIAHRCNGLEDVDQALTAGACAIECDVRYGRVTVFGEYGWYVDHDNVYAWSVELSDWLAKTRAAAAKFGDQLALIIFDIKTPERLDELRRLVRAALPDDLSVVFSIAEFKNRSAFDAIKGDLRYNEGLAIDQDNDPATVQGYFADDLRIQNYWYGNGIFVAGGGPNVRPSLVAASALRDAAGAGGGAIKKTYVWTLAAASSIADYIDDVHVDGVMVNPSTIETVVQHAAASPKVRRARRADRAFFRFDPGESGVVGPPSDITATFALPPDMLPIEAAIYWPSGKGYFFKGDRYVRVTPGKGVDPGYPRLIKDSFKQWPAGFFPLDAAVFWPPKGKVYFFKGDQYARYTPGEGIDAGYPRAIAGAWKGWPSGFWPVDAVHYWHSDKAYVFKGNQYLRCHRDPNGVGIEKGPAPIVDNWAKWPAEFLPMSSAVYWPDGLVYAFKGTKLIKYRPG